jgi:hypothetical protein
LKVFISDINVKEDKYGPDYFWITGRLSSGLEIIITEFYYDFRKYIGRHVEMLLCVLRSPYLELEKGIYNQQFLSEEYYSVELIDELLEKKGFNSRDIKRDIILTGEYIDSYIIPKKWTSLIEQKYFKILLKDPSAIKTSDGIFLLSPFHLRKSVPIEEFPREVTIATGSIDLVAWYPLSPSE